MSLDEHTIRFQDVSQIPCLVLSYGLDEVNKRSLEGILACDPRLLVDVVHNPSEDETGDFINFALGLVKLGNVNSLTLLEKNISNNAILQSLLWRKLDYLAHPFIILTDGDVVPGAGLIDEQLRILERHSEFLGCCMRVNPITWSDSYAGLKQRCLTLFNSPENERDDHLNIQGGVWMMMLRTNEFYECLNAIIENRRRFTDGNLGLFSHFLFAKKIVSTKASVGLELNRMRDGSKEDRPAISQSFSIHSPEPKGSMYSIWNHDLFSSGITHTQSGSSAAEFVALPPTQARHRKSLEQDSLFQTICDPTNPIRTANVALAVKSIEPATEEKIYFVILESGRKGIPASIRHASNHANRVVIFLSEDEACSDSSRKASIDQVELDRFILKRPLASALRMLSVIRSVVVDSCIMKGLCFLESDDRLSETSLQMYASKNHLTVSFEPLDTTKKRFQISCS